MKNLRTKISYALYALSVCVFISCGNQTTEQTVTNNVKEIDWDIELVSKYEIEEGGMKYILYRASGGLFILNITKDSLEVERLRDAQ